MALCELMVSAPDELSVHEGDNESVFPDSLQHIF